MGTDGWRSARYSVMARESQTMMGSSGVSAVGDGGESEGEGAWEGEGKWWRQGRWADGEKAFHWGWRPAWPPSKGWRCSEKGMERWRRRSQGRRDQEE